MATGKEPIPTAGWQFQPEGLILASRYGFFQHCPLQDISSEIRLLRLVSTSSDSAVWHAALATYDRRNAPPYVAVSYTWGEKVLQEATVDGVSVLLRKNCVQDLSQVWRQWPDAYVWVDAVCINQLDLVEKNKQVEMMFETYRRASHIAACLGEHADDSAWLMVMVQLLGRLHVRLMRERGLSWIQALNDDEDEVLLHAPVWQCFMQALGEDGFLRLIKAMVCFATRTYWRRLWILQELAAAHRRRGNYSVSIFCGDSSIPALVLFSIFVSILQITLQGGPSNATAIVTKLGWHSTDTELMDSAITDLISSLESIIMGSTRDNLSVRLGAHYWRECSDPRDRLFGQHQLIDWDKSGITPILPDYSKTPWQLAMMAANAVDLIHITELLEALQISHLHQEMRHEVQERLAGHSTFLVPSSETEDYSVHWKAAQRVSEGHSYCVRLSRVNGILVAPLSKQSRPGNCTVEASDVAQLYNILKPVLSLYEARLPQVLQSLEGGRYAALLPQDAREGDLLTHAGLSDAGLLLVLRQSTSSESMYDVIGQGIVLNDHCVGPRSTPKQLHYAACECTVPHQLFTARVELRTTPSDALVLMGQDLLLEQGLEDWEKWDQVARLLRPVTKPLMSPTGAAKITKVSCAEMQNQNR